MFGGMLPVRASHAARHRSKPTRSRRYDAQCMSSTVALETTSCMPWPRRTTSRSARSAPSTSPIVSSIVPRSPSALGTMLLTIGERSEEHTSELQSQSNLVCRLLLEKKKKKNKKIPSHDVKSNHV